jgi:predicted ATPase
MIFEDVHWTDPTSLEAFGRTVDRLKTLRVLLIITMRMTIRTVRCCLTTQPHSTMLIVSFEN